MPGFILHQGASVICSHAGTAQPTSFEPRVKVGGQPVIVISNSYVISGCGLTGTPTPPCVTGQWVTAATRVLANGQPVVIQGSQGVCPPGQLKIIATQTRVTAS